MARTDPKSKSGIPKPKTRGRPPVPPPVDIRIPFPHIPPYFQCPEFFISGIPLEISLADDSGKILPSGIGSETLKLCFGQ